MIRGFYAASSGLISQQNYLNNIANNIANVNTTAFKPQVTAFSSLLYENIDGGSGTNISTGLGAKVEKNGINFTESGQEKTDMPLDCAIDGNGFFAVQNKSTNAVTYTRDGAFSVSVEGDQKYLVNAEGNYVLGKDNNPINMTNGFDANSIGLFSFSNPYGLQLMGSNQYSATNVSGQATVDNQSTIKTGYLESSGTDLAGEMTKMIEASKAFSFNSKILQATDDMEKVVNQLR
ncbi:flagellar hook-basal body protein [Acetobacterium tundrae]|uniref:Flagellar hook-basal body complex protein n=1 Tax=Acetobacterium tundrae TaxID=132932 RepID=A0ABR6WKR6_9FIRM|nr:flagellar hook-basal body protein [Acetobacterium tundrae]MBC3797075.1 flagellar hook-basal body complex protein [Acetobacterium tundrae]